MGVGTGCLYVLLTALVGVPAVLGVYCLTSLVRVQLLCAVDLSRGGASCSLGLV
jgi:hypothetical protein